MDKLKTTLLISFGLFLVLITSSPIFLSIYHWDATLFYVGGSTVVRRDVFDTIMLVSLGSFLASFLMLLRRRSKRTEA